MNTYLITYSNNRNYRIEQWLLKAQDQAQAKEMFWEDHDNSIVSIDAIEEA
jgi:hypothetical protein